MSRQLFEALEASDVDAVRRLVRRGGVPLDKKDRLGRTVLHHAALRGATDFVLALLKYGASPNVPDLRGWTPLHFAASHRYGSHDLCTAMLEHGPDLDRGRLTPAAVARLHGATIASKLERKAPAPPLRHAELEQQLLDDRERDPDPDLWSVYADWILEQGDASGAWLAFTEEERARVLGESAGVLAEVMSWNRSPPLPELDDWLQVEWCGPFPARLRMGALCSDPVNQIEVLHSLIAHPLMRFVREIKAPAISTSLAQLFERLNELPVRPFLRRLSLELGSATVGSRIRPGVTISFAPNLEELVLVHHGGLFNLTQPGVKRVELTVGERSRVQSLDVPDACELRISGPEAVVAEMRSRAIVPLPYAGTCPS